MKLIDSGIVFEGKAGTSSAGYYLPNVCALSDGSILVVHRVSSGKMSDDEQVQFLFSKDGGHTWSDPDRPFDPVFNGVAGPYRAGYASESGKARYWPLCTGCRIVMIILISST